MEENNISQLLCNLALTERVLKKCKEEKINSSIFALTDIKNGFGHLARSAKEIILKPHEYSRIDLGFRILIPDNHIMHVNIDAEILFKNNFWPLSIDTDEKTTYIIGQYRPDANRLLSGNRQTVFMFGDPVGYISLIRI